MSAAAQGAPLEPLPTGPNPAVTGVAYSDPDTGECRATFAFAYLDVDTRYWLVARQHDGTIIDAIDIVVAEESVNFGGTYRWQVQFHVSDGERVPIHAEVYDTADYSSLLADGGFISCQGMLP